MYRERKMAVEVNIYDPKNRQRHQILEVYGTLTDSTVKIQEILKFMETQHYSDQSMKTRVIHKLEHLSDLLSLIGHFFATTSDQRVLRFLLFLDQLGKLAKINGIPKEDEESLLSKISQINVLDSISVVNLLSVVLNLSQLDSLINLEKIADFKGPSLGSFAGSDPSSKVHKKLNLRSCESPLSKECIESGVQVINNDLGRLWLFLESYKHPINASLANLNEVFEIGWRHDYVSETPMDYISSLSLYDQPLISLMLFYQSAVQPDRLPFGWKRSRVVANGDVVYENRALRRTQTTFPEDRPENGELAIYSFERQGSKQKLPVGWEAKVDPKTGYTYYFNRATGRKQLVPPMNLDQDPVQVPVKPRASTLPHGWEKAHDPRTGHDFYLNRELNQTRWTPPPQRGGKR
jgi:hypothetical protein